MNGIEQTRKLARIRDVERRVAAVSVAIATTRISDAEARILRLDQLSRAIAVTAGLRTGDAFASGGECVARLLAGSIATTVERDRQVIVVEAARQVFGAADTRAEIAHRHVATAEQVGARNAELRAALKTPVQRQKS